MRPAQFSRHCLDFPVAEVELSHVVNVIYLLALSFANRNRGFWRLSDNAQSIASLPEDGNEQWRLYGFPQRRFTYSQKMEKFPFFGNIMQESFIALDLEYWLRYQPILRRFSET